MPVRVLPFTWTEFEHAIGRELPVTAKARIQQLVRNPTEETWADARSIVIAPHLSIMGETLWQCVEAVTLWKYPDGSVPGQNVVILALCYAAGIPAPQKARESL